MRLICTILTLVVLTGCATSKETYLPDGSKGYIVDCSSEVLNWGKCYQKAGDLCGAAGYDVVAGGSDQGMVVAGNQTGVYGGSVGRNMLIKCKHQ